MSDIHILEGSFRNNGSGSIQIAYHIPVPSTYRDGTIARYPSDYTRDSQVLDIDLNELEDIRMGTVYEYIEPYRINVNVDQATIVAAIRARWHDIQTIAAKQVRERYKYYGQTLSKS
jgi:hypothetical protein